MRGTRSQREPDDLDDSQALGNLLSFESGDNEKSIGLLARNDNHVRRRSLMFSSLRSKAKFGYLLKVLKVRYLLLITICIATAFLVSLSRFRRWAEARVQAQRTLRHVESREFIQGLSRWTHAPPLDLPFHNHTLGSAADASYHLGTTDYREYFRQLENFILEHLPSSDGDAKDPSSILNALRKFYPSPHRQMLPSIPLHLTQTAASRSILETHGEFMKSWRTVDPLIATSFFDDTDTDQYVRRRFALGSAEAQVPPSAESDRVISRGVVEAWDKLANPRIMQSDFFRYLHLAFEGGIYADTDVSLLKPVKKWSENPIWQGERPEDFTEPSLIVGIESDSANRTDWSRWYTRPLQFSQWTMASTRGHPVMLDVVRRIVMATQDASQSPELKEGQDPGSLVLNLSGPGVWTDAVMAWLKVRYDVDWTRLKDMTLDGWHHHDQETGEWGDTRILQITGFSPSVGSMNALSFLHEAAMVLHHFKGTWKTADDT